MPSLESAGCTGGYDPDVWGNCETVLCIDSRLCLHGIANQLMKRSTSCVQGLRAALEQAVKMVTNPVSSTISLWRYGQYGKDRLAADAAEVSEDIAPFSPQWPGPLLLMNTSMD